MQMSKLGDTIDQLSPQIFLSTFTEFEDAPQLFYTIVTKSKK